MGHGRMAFAATILGIVCTAGVLLSIVNKKKGSDITNYILLSFSESLQEDLALDILDTLGYFGVISENGQSVFLDDFGIIKRLRLVRYREYVEPFDPRDDGYADKLHSLFVSDGNRRMFIPLEGFLSFRNPQSMANSLEAVFSEHAGMVQILWSPWRISLWLPTALVALVITLFISGKALRLLPLVPMVIALCSLGPLGLGLSSLLVAFFLALCEPIREWIYSGFTRASFRSYTDSFGLALLLALGYVLFTVILDFPLLITLLSIFGTLMIILAQALVLNGGWQEHRRFMPLPLFKPKVDWPRISKIILPFAALSIMTFFLNSYLSPSSMGSRPFNIAISNQDMKDHIAYQSSFSTQALGRDRVPIQYGAYMVGEDGLIAQAASQLPGPDYSAMELEESEGELRALARLLRLITGTALHEPSVADCIVMGCLLLMGLPGGFATTILRRRRKEYSVFHEKRVAA